MASSPCWVTSVESSAAWGAAAKTKRAPVWCRRRAERMSSHVGGEGWVVGPRVGACTAFWALSVHIWSCRSMPDVLPDLARGPFTAVHDMLSR
eukprot:7378533-Prymnesium_polylepis.1